MGDSYTAYFAEIYDDVMKQVPYDFWFKYLKDLLKYYRLKPKNILELAAGTGNMTRELIKLDSAEQITALDLSDSMLNIAADKIYSETKTEAAPELNLFNSDMRDFRIDNKHDLILSFFDSLNYLTEKEGLKSCFISAAEALKKDGIFIFDMNSIDRIHTIEEKKIVLEGKGYTCFWEDIILEDEDLWKVKLQICPEDKDRSCFEEIHTERGYSIETIRELLYMSGFKAVDVYRAFSLDKGSDRSDRLYFAAALTENRLNNNRGKPTKYYYSFKNDLLFLLYSLKYSFLNR